MPLRTVRSPKALWYFVSRVSSSFCVYVDYRLFCCIEGLPLGVLVRGAVPKVLVGLLLASFNLRTGSRFREGSWKVISLPFVLSRDHRRFLLFCYLASCKGVREELLYRNVLKGVLLWKVV